MSTRCIAAIHLQLISARGLTKESQCVNAHPVKYIKPLSPAKNSISHFTFISSKRGRATSVRLAEDQCCPTPRFVCLALNTPRQSGLVVDSRCNCNSRLHFSPEDDSPSKGRAPFHAAFVFDISKAKLGSNGSSLLLLAIDCRDNNARKWK